MNPIRPPERPMTGRRRSAHRLAAAVGFLLTAFAAGSARAAAQEGERVLGIGEAVRVALESNRQLIAARLGLAEADERISEAWSNVYPSVDFNASYTRNVSPTVNFLPARFFGNPDAGPDEYVAVQFGADNQWSSTIALEQPIFRAGLFVAVGAAGRYGDLQQEVVRGASHDVVTRVRLAYYDALLAQEQHRLIENSVRRVRASLAETKALAEAGLSSDYDVLRLEVELANLEPNLLRSANAVLEARRTLAVQLDIADHESVRVQGSLADMDLEDPASNSSANREILSFTGMEPGAVSEVDEALRMTEELRSDLRQLRLTESLRHTEMRLEQMEYLPNVTFFGNYIISAQDNGAPNFFARGDGQRAYSRLIGVRVSIPIFQGFRRDARIDQKRALLRQAETQTRQATDVARAEVENLVDLVTEASARARGQRLAVRQAQRGFEIARAQYREGLGSQLELTDAEVALRQSEFNYAQAVYDYLVARARLDQATGRVPAVEVAGQRTEDDGARDR